MERSISVEITTLDDESAGAAPGTEDLDETHAALERLAAVDSSLAEVVNFKFFCGFSFGEIAATKGISERIAQRSRDNARILPYRPVGEGTLD